MSRKNHFRSARSALGVLIAAAALSCGASAGKEQPKVSGGEASVPAAQQSAALPESKDGGGAATAAGGAGTVTAAGQAAGAENTSSEKAADAAKAEDSKKRQAQAAEKARLAALPVPSPVIAAAPGVFASAVSVTIQVPALKEALTVYTTDGTDPSPAKGIRYAGPFTVSASAVVKAISFIPGANKSAVVSADYTIGEVCAAPGASGDGRRSAPFGSIRAAIAKARTLGIGQVKLASGSFEESIEIDAPIVLAGGFRSDFASAADSRTAVRGKATGSASKKAPLYAIKASGKAADSKTMISGIEFHGPEASYTAGILVSDGAAPEFADCASFGGEGNYGYGAVAVSGAFPVFRSCRLNGGGGATSYGLSVDGAKATVESSALSAGTGAVGGYGLVATDASVAATASVIAANAANVGYGAAFYNSKGSRLERCTIVGGKGKDACGVFISASDPSIDRCVVSVSGSAKSYGVTANYGESVPSLLSRSVFVGCAGGVYYEAQTKIAYSAFNASGRLSGADGRTPSRPLGEGNSVGAFALGAAPLYATPSGSGIDAGAPVLTFR